MSCFICSSSQFCDLYRPLRLPVIPHSNLSIGSSSVLRKSTHVMPCKKMGKFGSVGAPSNSTGITGHLRLTNSRKNAFNSCCCQGPIPSLPTKTAADLILPICSSNSVCHGSPGCNSHSSSHGNRPRFCNSSPIFFTAGLSIP